MTGNDYKNSITVGTSAEEVFARIGRVSEWWGADVNGKSQNKGDLFTIRFGETRVTFEIIDAVLHRRIAWEVTDCYLHWLNDKTEWTGTKIVWDIVKDASSTRVDFTHVGLVPEIECFNDCRVGWDFYVQKSLFKLLTENKGLPDQG